MTTVGYRPRRFSATKAPKSGSSKPAPDHKLTLAAAAAVDWPSGPVRYVIRFEPTP